MESTQTDRLIDDDDELLHKDKYLNASRLCYFYFNKSVREGERDLMSCQLHRVTTSGLGGGEGRGEGERGSERDFFTSC